MKINLRKEIAELKNLLQTVVQLQDSGKHPGLVEIQALKALHKAEILDIQLRYPSAAARDIVETDIDLAQDLSDALKYCLKNENPLNKEVA
tara:strand:- start:2504 stop:2776 length:273 start_codon:yes stop_codon:yes gene_type:complete